MLNTYISNYFKYNFCNLVTTESFSTEILRKDGLNRFFDIQATPLISNNAIVGIHLSIIDISKYKGLEVREKLFFEMFENAKDIVCRYELLPEQKFTYLSHSVEDILGYTVEEYLEDPMFVFGIIHPDDIEIQYSKINSNTDFSKLFQLRFRHKDGHYLWLEDYIIPTYNANGELIAIESITRNIQGRKELEQRLEKLGHYDDLTGLFNKNYLLKEMGLLSNTINLPVGIIVCDLDNLKCINDTLGHYVGDNLLINTAKVLASVFHCDAVISRTGGDEFVVVIKNKSYFEVDSLYSKLLAAIKQYNINSTSIPIEISIGLAYSDTSISKMENILNIADINMYANKNQKKHN